MGSRQRSFHDQHRGTCPGASTTDSWLPLFVVALSVFLGSLMIFTSMVLGEDGRRPLPTLSQLAEPLLPARGAEASEGTAATPGAPPTANAEQRADVPPPVKARGDTALQRAIEGALGEDTGHLSVAVRRLTDGRSASIDGDREFYAASTFKLAILYEAERQRSLGLLNLDDEIQFSEEVVSEDLGTLSEVPFEADDGVVIRNALRAMVTLSDNSSAVALLHLLGGGTVDGTLRELGLTSTSVNTIDLPTTANDMAILMEAIVSGRGVSTEARGEMRGWLLAQGTRSGIPEGIPDGVNVGNKTGTWEGATHDIAFVEAPGGTYVVAILSDQGWEWLPLVRVSEAIYAALLAAG